MDELTTARVKRLLDSFKSKHGRDINLAELRAAGFSKEVIDHLVRHKVLTKYQATTGKGTIENRFKLHTDWRSLRET